MKDISNKVECPRCKGCGYVEKKKKRSLNQNRYYWGVVVLIFAFEIGEEKDDMHEILKYKFHSEEKLIDNEIIKVPKSTHDMTTAEFEIYLKKIRKWAVDLNIIIPEPNQIDEDLLIEIERSYNKMFL